MQHLAGMRRGTRPCASQPSALPSKTRDGNHRIAVIIPHALGRRAPAEVEADDRTASHARAGFRRTAPEDPARRRNRDMQPTERSFNPRQQRGSRSAPQESTPPTSSQGLPPSHRSVPLDLDWKAAPRPPREVDFRRMAARLLGPPAASTNPRMNALIIVEGFNDCFAVHRAVQAPVYILKGGLALAEEMKPELHYLMQLVACGMLPRQVVVLTDPDWQGRQFRTYLDDLLKPQQQAQQQQQQQQQQRGGMGARGQLVAGGSGPEAQRVLRPRAAGVKARAGEAGAGGVDGEGGAIRGDGGPVLRHAFLRVELGTSLEDSRNHEAGNVGVEHASPDTLRAMLRRARPSFGTGRTEFSLDELRGAGLFGDWQDKEKVMGPKLRRIRYCAALGLDNVGTGKGLLNLLNRFFTREEHEEALRQAQEEPLGGQQQQQQQ